MKFIINVNGLQRTIEGPFEIVASGADFLHLVQQIENEVKKREEGAPPFCYGRIQIAAPFPYAGRPVTKAWDE